MTALWTVAGGVLILVALVDVFQTLLRPGTTGRLSLVIFRAAWAMTRRRPRLGVTGPLMVVAVVTAWVLLLTVGWALIYLPHIPDGFVFSVDVTEHHPFAEALTISLVALTTLGYGDAVPTQEILRLVSPLEALTGFVLLSGAVAWFMELYPALTRRRAVAVRLNALHAAGVVDGIDQLSRAHAVEIVADVARALAELTADVTQTPEVYYFTEREERLSAPAAVRHALRLRDAAGRSADADVRAEGRVLGSTLDELAHVVRHHYRHLTGDTTDEVLLAVARSHGHDGDAAAVGTR